MLFPAEAHGFRDDPSVMCTLRRMAQAALIVAAAFSAHADAHAAGCPAADGDGRLRLIAAAKSCRAAVRINDACSEGTGADTEPTAAVISLCEEGFKPKLLPPRRKAYEASLAACEKKYENQTGTMYRSFTVYCQEHVAARYLPR